MVRLGEMTWPEVSGAATLLVPLGSTEQHGPHLPTDTDTRIAVALAEAAAAAADTAVVLAPAMAFGASGEHADFAGTLSIGVEVLRNVIIELVRSASLTFGRTVFVNGHGGNHGALASAVAQMVDEGHRVTAWWPRIADGDAHAGRTETSLMLAIAPNLVRFDRAEPGNVEPIAELLPRLRAAGVASVAPNGVLGDPTASSAAEGERLLADLVADLVSTIDRSR